MHTATQWLYRAELAIVQAQAAGTIGDETLTLILESIRAALLKMDATRPILGGLSGENPTPLTPEGERLLVIQTAMSQWLYGRMMDEDACTSLLRIARTSAGLWSYMTAPAAARITPPSLWHAALYADAVDLFGHHFSRPTPNTSSGSDL